jgi:hypothetical protein
VEGAGQGFYIWSSDLRSDLVKNARRGWKETGRVESVPIYGNGRLWRWWVAERADLVVWLSAGPYEKSRLPTLAEMKPLIRSSEMLPFTW